MLSRGAIRRRLAAQHGFTLIELLVSMLIGMVVLMGVLSLTEVGARSASRTSDRAETTQRSRTAMNRIVQGLRVQVCPSISKPPIATATKDADGVEQLTYYAELGDLDPANPRPLPFAPQKRRLTFDPRGAGSIVEEVWDANRKTEPADEVGEPAPPLLPGGQPDPNADPKLTYPASPTRTRTLATQIKRVVKDGVDIDFLRYYDFENPVPLSVDLNTTTAVPSGSIPANSIARVARVDVSFNTRPSNGNTDELRDSDLQTSVSPRNTDFTDQPTTFVRQWGPRCD